MKNRIISALVLSGLAASLGCSVKGGSVEKNPPTIEPLALAFGVKYGQMKTPDSVSAMMWPKEWSETEMAAKVQVINQASVLITQYSADVWSKQSIKSDMWDAFVASKCISRFRLETDTSCAAPEIDKDDPTNCNDDNVVPWKTVAPTAPPEIADFVSCQQNQIQRLDLKAEIDKLALPRDRESDLKKNSIYNLNAIIAENSGPDASLKIDSAHSSLVINDPRKSPNAPPVVITVAGFNGIDSCHGGKSPCLQTSDPRDDNGQPVANDLTAIHDVSIDANGRRIKFTVPDLQTWDNHTKRYIVEYQFDLSRNSNAAELQQKTTPAGAVVAPSKDFAVFKGDVVKVLDGKVVQKGSGQIFGEFTAFQ